MNTSNCIGDAPTQRALTPREREVCRLVALGHTNADIALRLRISDKTVESHRKHIMAKLGFRRRVELVAFAFDRGLLPPSLANTPFHHCPTCDVRWSLSRAFLSDPEVAFRGYQHANGGRPSGILIFEHRRCGTRLPCLLEWFQELVGQPLLAASCTAIGRKDERCLLQDGSQSCPLECVCGFVWRVSQIIKSWPKESPCAETDAHRARHR